MKARPTMRRMKVCDVDLVLFILVNVVMVAAETAIAVLLW